MAGIAASAVELWVVCSMVCIGDGELLWCKPLRRTVITMLLSAWLPALAYLLASTHRSLHPQIRDITTPGYPTRRGAQRVASKEAT